MQDTIGAIRLPAKLHGSLEFTLPHAVYGTIKIGLQSGLISHIRVFERAIGRKIACACSSSLLLRHQETQKVAMDGRD